MDCIHDYYEDLQLKIKELSALMEKANISNITIDKQDVSLGDKSLYQACVSKDDEEATYNYTVDAIEHCDNKPKDTDTKCCAEDSLLDNTTSDSEVSNSCEPSSHNTKEPTVESKIETRVAPKATDIFNKLKSR